MQPLLAEKAAPSAEQERIEGRPPAEVIRRLRVIHLLGPRSLRQVDLALGRRLHLLVLQPLLDRLLAEDLDGVERVLERVGVAVKVDLEVGA